MNIKLTFSSKRGKKYFFCVFRPFLAYSYGVVDHPDEKYENDKMTLLESKNNEIVLLKQEILMLKKLIE